jgi:hypothetical protein
MKRMILTPAVLMAATLFTAAAVHAQSAATAKAYPPGPSADAYPPGPSGQAAAQTANVNVVNAPTVMVGNTPTVNIGNAVTLNDPVREPLYVQKVLDMINGVTFNGPYDIHAPAGKRMVIENVTLGCGSGTAQPVGALIYRPNLSDAVVTVMPPVTPWGSGSVSQQTVSVHLLVDDYVRVATWRPTGASLMGCALTLVGYLTPLP